MRVVTYVESAGLFEA